MLKILSIILLKYISINCLVNEPLKQNNPTNIVEGIYQIYNIQYRNKTSFIFDNTEGYTYQANIYSINCNINIDFEGKLLNKINLDTYSLVIDDDNNQITITPLIDVIDGIEKENYDSKSCRLSINFIQIEKNSEIKFEKKKEPIIDSFIYFNHSYLNSAIIIYELKNSSIENDNFAAIFFQFNEKSKFSINVTNLSNNNTFSKNIFNSTYVFLNSTFLQNNLNNENITLSINVQYLDTKALNLRFKIVEKDSISIMQKNALNYGFITSKTYYQYYYMEVFKGEEGEIILHNKRLYGTLYAKLIEKNKMDEPQLYNISNYPIEPLNETDHSLLDYNPHTLKLNYSYINTSICFYGCYLLITYERKKAENESYYPLIGYEFTLLSRNWNYSDYISQIIDIPFNEYIIGSFEKGSFFHHYYSITKPDEADIIIIQIEGNYLSGYYGEGRKKINTFKSIENNKELEIYNNQNVLTLNLSELNYTEKTISFAFRPKDYLTEIFSFYYFRIFYSKKDETIFFPLDSHFGNLCLPKKEEGSDKFYCYAILTNNYKELETKFAITSSNQNEYFSIEVSKLNKDGNIIDTKKEEFLYLFNGPIGEIEYILFKFEYKDQEIKNIISAFYDRFNNTYLQIYSPQMFYINNIRRKYLFKLKNNYTLTTKYVYGIYGTFSPHFLDYQKFYLSRNYKGKPFSIPIDNNATNFFLNSSERNGDFICFFQLTYNMKNKRIEEIKTGETWSQVKNECFLPLLYYLKIKDKDYINIDINFRLNSYNETFLQSNFYIVGYLVDEDTIKRKINGEYIILENPIEGIFSDQFKIGLLQINTKLTNNKNYVLIEIGSNEQKYINSYLLVELITKEYYENLYFMPTNQYFVETFDDKNKYFRKLNQYQMNIKDIDSQSQVLLELSPQYNDIEIVFDKDMESNLEIELNYTTGFKKYRIYCSDCSKIYFNVTNPGNKNANYMLRYFYTIKKHEHNYYLDDEIKINVLSLNNENADISLTFNALKISTETSEVNRSDIYFYIYGLLFNASDNTEELINTTSFYQERKPLYKNMTKHNYSLSNPKPFKLIFENISRKGNCIFDLQLKLDVKIKDNLFNEEFLIYTFKIDLNDIRIVEEPKKDYTIIWIIATGIIGVIAISLILFFMIKYRNAKQKNTNLEEEIKSIAFSSNVQKNIIKKEQCLTKKETDYDTTFI